MGCIEDAQVRPVNETDRTNRSDILNRTTAYPINQTLQVGTSNERLEVSIVNWENEIPQTGDVDVYIELSLINIGAKAYKISSQIGVDLVDTNGKKYKIENRSTNWVEVLPPGRGTLNKMVFSVPFEEVSQLELWIIDRSLGWHIVYRHRTIPPNRPP